MSLVAAAASGCKPSADPVGTATPTPPRSAAQDQPAPPVAAGKTQPDLSGRARVGDASFYANKFAGKAMADGAEMNPQGDNAASKTLPLGTTATVTNLQTGQSAVVTIEDRGPYVKGRILDLSPGTAREIGITGDAGVAKVKVSPISVPLPDGGTKRGVDAVVQEH